MTCSSLTVALLLACGIGATALASQAQKSPSPTMVVGQALGDKPESRAEGREAIDGAVAAAMIGAISRQFGERNVEVKLDKVDVLQGNVIERVVRGHGRLQIGGEAEWLGFDFDAVYDTEQATVYYPRLVLGENNSRKMAADSSLARGLAVQAERALGEEFAQQSVEVSLNDITTRDAGKRYLQIHATGIVQFEGEGAAEALLTAVYDRQKKQWVQVDYELGSSSSQALGDAVAAL